MARVPTTGSVAAASLVGGYLTARVTKVRGLGAVPLVAGGAWCTYRWKQRAGIPTATGLLALYLAGFGASHPLAKRIGAWPAVLVAAGASGVAAWMLVDRRG